MKSIAASVLLLVVMATQPAEADCLSDRGLACYRTEQTKPDSTRGGVSASTFCAMSAVVECGQGSGGGRVQAPSDRSYEPKSLDHSSAVRRAEALKLTVDDKHSSTFAIKDGSLKISPGSRYGETPEVKPYIKYNDNLIEEFSDIYLSVDGFVSLGEYAVLLYSTNPGGSGTLDSHSLVSVDSKGTIYRADLPAGYQRFEYQVANGTISFELGVDEGQEIRAVFANGRLSVTKRPIPKGGLPDEDCNMLYNGILDECARPDQKTCAYNDMTISMASQRPVNLLSHNNPNYRDADFKLACEQACKAKKKPALAGFRKAVCQSR